VRWEELAVVAVVVTTPAHRPLCHLDCTLALFHAGEAVPQVPIRVRVGVPMGRHFTREELCTVPAQHCRSVVGQFGDELQLPP